MIDEIITPNRGLPIFDFPPVEDPNTREKILGYTVQEFWETFDLFSENSVKRLPYCDYGHKNEWIRIDENMSFWGCKPCYHKKMKSLIKLVKPEG